MLNLYLLLGSPETCCHCKQTHSKLLKATTDVLLTLCKTQAGTHEHIKPTGQVSSTFELVCLRLDTPSTAMQEVEHALGSKLTGHTHIVLDTRQGDVSTCVYCDLLRSSPTYLVRFAAPPLPPLPCCC